MGKKLLILGAGGHGRVVREIALSLNYEKVDFLDDSSGEALGKIEDLEKLGSKYSDVFCGIGNNTIRKALLEKVENLGFSIPILIHPTAYISPSAMIEKGTVVEPKAIVNTNSIVKKGCIISVGAIVDHDVIIEDYTHINAGAICKAGSHIRDEYRLDAGKVYQYDRELS